MSRHAITLGICQQKGEQEKGWIWVGEMQTDREVQTEKHTKTYSEDIFIFFHLYIYKIQWGAITEPHNPPPSSLSSPHEKKI